MVRQQCKCESDNKLNRHQTTFYLTL